MIDWILSTLWYLTFVVLLTGLVSAVKPIRIPVFRTRRRGLVIAALAAATIAIVGSWTPPVQQGGTATKLDNVMPRYQFREVHSRTIAADPAQVLRSVKEVAADEIALFELFTTIRRFGRPAPESILNPPAGVPILDVALRSGFILVAEDEHEIVLGTVLASAGSRRHRAAMNAAWFLGLTQPGIVKAAMNFHVRPLDARTTTLTTETRVLATDDESTRRFTPYWRTIFPGSWILRVTWLRAIEARATRDSMR